MICRTSERAHPNIFSQRLAVASHSSNVLKLTHQQARLPANDAGACLWNVWVCLFSFDYTLKFQICCKAHLEDRDVLAPRKGLEEALQLAPAF